jgi:hypothetical protein
VAKEWMKMDEKQQSILALQTEIEEVKAQAATAARGKRKNDGNSKRAGSSEWAWKKVPPRPGEPKKKKFKGKTYYWCSNYKLWCLHKPSECKLRSDDTKKEGKQNREKLKMRVYQSLFKSSSDEEESNQGDNDKGEESDGNNSDDNSNTSE